MHSDASSIMEKHEIFLFVIWRVSFRYLLKRVKKKRNVPFTAQDQINKELDRLEQAGILSKKKKL